MQDSDMPQDNAPNTDALESALRHLHAEMDSANQEEQLESESVRTAIWAVRDAIRQKRLRLRSSL